MKCFRSYLLKEKMLLLKLSVRTTHCRSEKYHIPCLFAQISADIEIVPLDSAYGNVNEVKVTLFPATTCTVAHKLNQSQQLINIGKIASTLAHGVRNPLNAIKGACCLSQRKMQHRRTTGRIYQDHGGRDHPARKFYHEFSQLIRFGYGGQGNGHQFTCLRRSRSSRPCRSIRRTFNRSMSTGIFPLF